MFLGRYVFYPFYKNFDIFFRSALVFFDIGSVISDSMHQDCTLRESANNTHIFTVYAEKIRVLSADFPSAQFGAYQLCSLQFLFFVHILLCDCQELRDNYAPETTNCCIFGP